MENQKWKTPATTEKSVEAGQYSAETPVSTLARLGWVGSITVGNIIVLGGGGYLLDQYFGTKPWLMIAGMVLAFVSTQVMVYRKMTALMKKGAKEN